MGTRLSSSMSTHYGNDVHEFLASKQLAPWLHSCSPLRGEWCDVVMNKVDGPLLVSPVDKQVKESFKGAVKMMHDAGYVQV